MRVEPSLFDEGFDDRFDALFVVARGVSLRVGGDAAEAEDIASETLARALVRWKQLHDAPYLEAWVAKVAGNLAIDAVRRRQRASTQLRSIGGAVADDRSDELVVRDALAEALGRLPRRQREVVVLRHLVGNSEAEVAAALDISVNSVKKHAQRGLGKLRAGLVDPEEVQIA